MKTLQDLFPEIDSSETNAFSKVYDHLQEMHEAEGPSFTRLGLAEEICEGTDWLHTLSDDEPKHDEEQEAATKTAARAIFYILTFCQKGPLTIKDDENAARIDSIKHRIRLNTITMNVLNPLLDELRDCEKERAAIANQKKAL